MGLAHLHPRRMWLAAALAAPLALGSLNACQDSRSGSSGGSASTGGAATTPTTGGSTLPSQPRAGSWLKGDLHVHTHYSGDTGRFGNSIASLIGMSEYAGLDYVVLGDHRDTKVLQDPELTQTPTALVVIPGMEWGGGGHAGAHGLVRQPIHVSQTGSNGQERKLSIDAAIADVHQQGGFFVLNHPCDPRNPFPYPTDTMDGIEIWNGLWALRAQADYELTDLQGWEQRQGITASPEIRIALGHVGGGKNHQALKLWEAHLDAGRRMAAVGGGDHHYLVLPGMPTTLVHASANTQAAITQGIREARTIVARGPNAPSVEFTADGNGDGVYESIIGDTIPLGGAIAFRLRVTGAVGGKVQVIKNGRPMQSFVVGSADETFTFADTPTTRSWYRVDVWEPLDLNYPQARNLRLMVMGLQGQSWTSAITSAGGFLSGLTGWLSGMLTQVQDIVETGAPAAAWLLVFGQQMGVSFAPTPTRYPIVEWPEEVSRILNVDLLDPDFCRSVVTSPIWAE